MAERWKRSIKFGCVIAYGPKEDDAFQCDSMRDTDKALDAHNADCDAYEARIAELEADVKTWQANERRQTQAIELLRKDAERIDDLEEDFSEIQHIMGCNHEDMHHCVSTMEQELSETKAELARVKPVRLVPLEDMV